MAIPTTFTIGSVVNPDLWCVLFPTGSAGIGANLPLYLLNTLQSKGIFMAGAWWMGCDQGEEDYGARYFQIGAWIQSLMVQYSLTTPPVLYCQSRGGLQGLSFAAEAPSLVNRIACLYTVSDPAVYPGLGSAFWNAHNKQAREYYALMSLQPDIPVAWEVKPNIKMSSLSGKKVCVWHGDSDLTVPKNHTTDIWAPLCSARVKTLQGFGHETPSNATLDEIIDFIQWGIYPTGAVIAT